MLADQPAGLANGGKTTVAQKVQFYKADIFDAIARTQPGAGGEIQLTDAIRLLLKEGGKVYGVRLHPNEIRYDVGNFDSYFRAFVEFALADKKCGASLRQYLENLLDDHHS